MHDSSRLPGPIFTLWGWQYQGVCLGIDSPISLHPEGKRGGFRRRRDERAEAIYQDCPVLDKCRDHVLSTREPYGIWKDMSEKKRRAYYERQARRFADEPA